MPRILLVEGDPHTRAVLTALLDLEGYELDVAASLAEAAGRAPADYDAAVVATSLPDGDGIELRRGWSDAPELTVALSDRVDDDVRRRAGDAGFDLWLATPFSPVELIDALEEATPGPGRE